jgi:hypothetical protein
MDRDEWRKIVRALTERDCNGGREAPARTRKELEARHGQVWDSYTLARDFEIEAFTETCIVVVRRSDGVRGTVRFQWYPRFYWKFEKIRV